MPANPWELRADVRPLEAAAQRWTEVGALVARRGDELVDAARRATEGWDAAAAESYERHRRQVLANLDRFTTLTAQISGALAAAAAVMTSSQKELDRAWSTVAAVPHETVGESRHLVFKPSEDHERGKVAAGQAETEEIRRRLTLALDQESARLRSARAELVTVGTELMTLTGSALPGFTGPGQDEPGVGTVPALPTSVPGAAQGGGVTVSSPTLGPVAVSMPDLTGVSGMSGGLTSLAAAAGGVLGRRGRRTPPQGTPPVGGMGAGAMAARAGTTSRGMASGRTGPARVAAPRLEKTAAEEAAARADREKEAVREAKRAAVEEKRAERAARRAEREAEREAERRSAGSAEGRVGRDRDRRRLERDQTAGHRDDEAGERAERNGPDEQVEGAEARPPAIRVVHERAPGADQGPSRR